MTRRALPAPLRCQGCTPHSTLTLGILGIRNAHTIDTHRTTSLFITLYHVQADCREESPGEGQGELQWWR